MGRGALFAVAALTAGAPVALASGDVAGTLAFKTKLSVVYPPTTCPAGTPDGIACFARTGKAAVRGLGKVDESYAYLLDEHPAGCSDGSVRGLPSTARLAVLGKGTIEIRVSGTECLIRELGHPVEGSETFTIAGGTGIYANAGGGGTIHHISYGPPCWCGTDTWSGTITVPGLEFDLTPPTIRGAVNKRVRAPRGAKRIRVRYEVTAQDDVDGALRAVCRPKSGARFRVGRTVVRCSATDRSANTAKARFRVTVKQRGKR